ncbi:hypothetical protein M9H77_13526 [Catharanthus roseus]|uniref:Uncharacterized protein n=1 Tax=Catharanthus roseus TaxID=4058 RepID=A0ACC0BKE7_CATRO|nr:hypothetical protein M9H77_13526 [Catharanthus roseus]
MVLQQAEPYAYLHGRTQSWDSTSVPWIVSLHELVCCKSSSNWYRVNSLRKVIVLLLTITRSLSRFHPNCIEMTAEEAKRLDHFYCENCSSEDGKKLHNSHAASRDADAKVILLLPLFQNRWKENDAEDDETAAEGCKQTLRVGVGVVV